MKGTSKDKTISIGKKIHRWLMQFNMCKCIEPYYEVANGGVLSCRICRKAVEWKENPNKAR